LADTHYENFPVASRLLPPALRGPVAVVYAFARTADDFADEPGRDDAERLRLLADWRRRLNDAFAGRHENHPVFWALSDLAVRFQLPITPFDRLITAFERDVTIRRFPTFDHVLDYCAHSANPVGELVLRLFGAWTPERGAWSDAICTALQLANFWQDVAVDAKKDRIYVPQEDLRAMGLSERAFLDGPFSEVHREILAFQVDRTWAIFRRGRPLCDAPAPVPVRWLRAVWLGGTRILEKIENRRWDTWTGRPALTMADGIRLLPRWLWWRR
jgi:squalene synthase HpnC